MKINEHFDVEYKTLGSLFQDAVSKNVKFRIPKYQRQYSWTTDNAEEMWEDIISDEKNNLFLGSIVINGEHIKKDNCYDIIDGQQRILTIAIFASALRDIAKEMNSDYQKNIQNKLIAQEDKFGNPTAEYRLICGQSISGFFEANIQSNQKASDKINPKSDEEKKAFFNYDFFKKKIKDYVKNQVSNIETIFTKILDIGLIVISIDSEDRAYEVFETINSRGVDLTVADLIKNLIFKHVGSDKFDNEWQYILENVSESRFEITNFIRYYWISKHESITKKLLFRKIKQKLNSEETHNKFLDELKVNSEILKSITATNFDLESEFWRDKSKKNKIITSLIGLREMKLSQQYVLLLSIFRHFNKLPDPSSLIEFIEKFSFWYFSILKQPGNQVEKIYSKYAQKIDKGTSIGEFNLIYSQIRNELLKLIPTTLTEEGFSEGIIKNLQYSKQDGLIKFILCRYYETEHSNSIVSDFKLATLEHIYPKNPNSSWTKAKKDDSLLNSIGNLLLLGDKANSTIGNNILSQKISGYEKDGGTRYRITREFCENAKSRDFVLRWESFPYEAINENLKKVASFLYEKSKPR